MNIKTPKKMEVKITLTNGMEISASSLQAHTAELACLLKGSLAGYTNEMR